MSRFVLDCAVSRPPDGQAAGWLATAAQRAWAPPTAGYHEAKTAQALLNESQQALCGLTGGRTAWFTADPATAVAAAVRDLASRGVFDVVVTGAADPLVLQEQSAAVAAQHDLPHRVAGVDDHARLVTADLPPRALLVTCAANPEIGTMQADLGPWLSDTASAAVVDATSAYGWADLPAWWHRLVLDPRAWGGAAGAVAVVSREAGGAPVTDAVPAAVVAGLAGQRWQGLAPSARVRTRAQVGHIRRRVLAELPDAQVHGGEAGDLPHVLSVSVLYVDGEALQSRLDVRGFAVGSGSACASRSGQPSHVLTAIGGLTSGNVRLGLPPDLPDDVPDAFVDALVAVVAELRAEMGTADL